MKTINAKSLKARIDALVSTAREYDRLNDATMRRQTVRSIEDLPGITVRQIEAAKKAVNAK